MYIILSACLMNVSALSKKQVVVALPTRRCCQIVSFYVNSAFLCHSALSYIPSTKHSLLYSTPAGRLQNNIWPFTETGSVLSADPDPLAQYRLDVNYFQLGIGVGLFLILKKKPRDS